MKRFSSESSMILAVYFVHSLIDRNEEFVSDTHSLTDVGNIRGDNYIPSFEALPSRSRRRPDTQDRTDDWMRARLTMTRLAVQATLKAGKDTILGFQMARKETSSPRPAQQRYRYPPARKRSTSNFSSFSAWSARAMGNPFDPYRYPYLLVSQMKDAW